MRSKPGQCVQDMGPLAAWGSSDAKQGHVPACECPSFQEFLFQKEQIPGTQARFAKHYDVHFNVVLCGTRWVGSFPCFANQHLPTDEDHWLFSCTCNHVVFHIVSCLICPRFSAMKLWRSCIWRCSREPSRTHRAGHIQPNLNQ